MYRYQMYNNRARWSISFSLWLDVLVLPNQNISFQFQVVSFCLHTFIHSFIHSTKTHLCRLKRGQENLANDMDVQSNTCKCFLFTAEYVFLYIFAFTVHNLNIIDSWLIVRISWRFVVFSLGIANAILVGSNRTPGSMWKVSIYLSMS